MRRIDDVVELSRPSGERGVWRNLYMRNGKRMITPDPARTEKKNRTKVQTCTRNPGEPIPPMPSRANAVALRLRRVLARRYMQHATGGSPMGAGTYTLRNT